MVGQFSVPQEGTYLINPDMNICNRPRNINDEDLLEGKTIVVRPREEPTNVSYFIQRVLLAEICRERLDRHPIGHQVPDSVQYRTTLEFDAKLNKLIKNLPAFMSLDSSRWKDFPRESPMRAPGTTMQRYIFNLVIHRQLCKAHLPYLTRGTVDPTYAASRDACLRSSRMIVKIEQEIERECDTFVSCRQRLTLVLRSMFLASIVLLLDACLKEDTTTATTTPANSANTPGSDGSLDEYNELLLVAWRLFFDARHYSQAAPKVLELSMEVLRKHKPDHPALKTMKYTLANPSTSTSNISSLVPTNANALPPTPESSQQKSAGSTTGGADEYSSLRQKQQSLGAGIDVGVNSDIMMNSLNGLADPAYLQQQWSSLDGSRMELEAVDWDRIVWGLDAPFI